MRRATDLESRLVEWGKEYGGGKYESSGAGGSWLASMIKWHGRPPSGLGFVPTCTAADEVQAAVDALARQEQGWVPSIVLRCEYWTPGQPLEAKLGRLRSIGQNLGRVRYYQHLRIGRIHVAGWMKLPFSIESEKKSLAGVE